MIKRRKFLVSKPVQLRYVGLVLIPLIALSTALYYLIYYSVFNQILIPEAIVSILLPAMKNVNIVMVTVVPIILFFVIRIALIYSNRLVGPLPRLEKELDRVIAGDRSIRLKVRDKDELNTFVGKVNALLEKISKG